MRCTDAGRPPRTSVRMKQTHKYEVVICWSAEDDAYIAEAPELPVCAADGAAYSEAAANVQTIIDEWIETARELGRPIPAPKVRLVAA